MDDQGNVTGDECRTVVRETGMKWLDHHRCGCCGLMVGHRFAMASEVFIDPSLEGLTPDDLLVGFDSSCDCSPRGYIRGMSWDEFADTFNMQPTKEGRVSMFERFKAGKATHERD